MKSLDTCLVLIVDDTETNIDILLATLGEDYEVAVATMKWPWPWTVRPPWKLRPPSGQTSSCSTS